ncbi:uncharacterized protein EMH_0019570 [Eimeria mitis]|uniref:HEAT repeat-containing protein n=1 Tax=Eimeria mitis TaxID=44415 RepID=U6KDF2_9EIME|nr:uncharacterized protein EMH_0019570 [Eimeria mitis]CDJ35964.1 hypothetical protein, conserved [Eimeria mitis]
MASASMDWHGIYKDLLFRRGAINPPCTHVKSDDEANSVLADRLTSNVGQRESAQSAISGIEGDEISTDPASFVRDFLSDSPRVRKRGCRNISRIFRALGKSVDEFLLFLQDFEEGEDNDDVLAILCNELKGFFDGNEDPRNGRDECPYVWAGGLSIISSLLLRIMLHRDRDLQTAALHAFTALLSTCNHAELLGNKATFQVLELCEDKQSAARQTAAIVIPSLLHCTRRCWTDLLEKQRAQGMPEDSHVLETLVELKQRLFTSYVELCGDRNCSVQLAAGQQLPLFVDYVAAEVEMLQQGFSTQQVADGAKDGGKLQDARSICRCCNGSEERSSVQGSGQQLLSIALRTSCLDYGFVQNLGNTFFMGDSWMLELNQIAEDNRENQGSRLPGACLNAVLALLPLSTAPQRRVFLELATDLAQRGNWKLKVSFLGCLGSLAPPDIAFVSPLILTSEFATDEDGEECWRVQAALAQQLPVLLRTLEDTEDILWERITGLLLSPTWAVRQEAGFALRSVAEDGYQRRQAMPKVEFILEQRLFHALQQVASCKNAFIRQDVAFYMHQIWDYLPDGRARSIVLPLLQSLLKDPAPCCRLALVKLLGRLLQKEASSQADLVDDLKQMMETLLRDESDAVREEALEFQEVLRLRATPPVN